MMACAGGDYRRRRKRGAGFRCALNCDSDAGTRAVGPGAGRCGGPHVPPRCPLLFALNGLRARVSLAHAPERERTWLGRGRLPVFVDICLFW